MVDTVTIIIVQVLLMVDLVQDLVTMSVTEVEMLRKLITIHLHHKRVTVAAVEASSW